MLSGWATSEDDNTNILWSKTVFTRVTFAMEIDKKSVCT